jgi:hypothetical protein
MRAELWVCVLSLATACSSGETRAPDASGSGGTGGGAGGGQAGTAAGGAGGQAGTAGGTGAGGRGGVGGGQAGTVGGAGGRGGGGGDACASLAGVTFRSVTEEECGRGPDGGLRCRWAISFTASMFNWQHSDFAETGTYTCSGAAVTGQLGAGRTIAGQYEAASQTLTWDGLAYTPQ